MLKKTLECPEDPENPSDVMLRVPLGLRMAEARGADAVRSLAWIVALIVVAGSALGFALIWTGTLPATIEAVASATWAR